MFNFGRTDLWQLWLHAAGTEEQMQKEKLEFLKEKAAELRKDVITMIYEAQSGHPGTSGGIPGRWQWTYWRRAPE